MRFGRVVGRSHGFAVFGGQRVHGRHPGGELHCIALQAFLPVAKHDPGAQSQGGFDVEPPRVGLDPGCVGGLDAGFGNGLGGAFELGEHGVEGIGHHEQLAFAQKPVASFGQDIVVGPAHLFLDKAFDVGAPIDFVKDHGRGDLLDLAQGVLAEVADDGVAEIILDQA